MLGCDTDDAMLLININSTNKTNTTNSTNNNANIDNTDSTYNITTMARQSVKLIQTICGDCAEIIFFAVACGIVQKSCGNHSLCGMLYFFFGFWKIF